MSDRHDEQMEVWLFPYLPLKERVVDDYYDPVRKGLIAIGLIMASRETGT